MGALGKSSKFDGYVLLVLGAVLIWIGGIFDNTPNWAHHRLLVASPANPGSVFDKSVILMLQHRKEGSFGLILNKPDKSSEFYIGGPMEMAEKTYALHSTDVLLPESILMKDINVAAVQGEGVKKLLALGKKPAWIRIIRGYSGWGKRQLNRELSFGTWSVIQYDEKLVRETKPEDMWGIARTKPALKAAN